MSKKNPGNEQYKEDKILKRLRAKPIPKVVPDWLASYLAELDGHSKLKVAARARVTPKGTGPLYEGRWR